jgi:O-antigen/teichoic acid export membrane protein
LPDDLSRVTEDSARSGFFLFSGSAVATIIMAVAAIIVGRLLGPDLYGQYNLVITVPALVLLFTDLGISTGITKFGASLHNEGNDSKAFNIIRYAFWFKFLIGILATVLSIAFAGYLALVINRPDYAFYVQIGSLAIVFQVVFGTVNSAFVGLDKSEYNALTTNVQAIAKTVLQILFVLLSFTIPAVLIGHIGPHTRTILDFQNRIHSSISGVLTGYVGGYTIAAIAGTFLLFHKLIRPANANTNAKTDQPAETHTQVLNLLARYGMPLYLGTLLAGFIPLYQKVVLGFFSSNVNIGNFSASANFVSLLGIIPVSITTALLPAFSKLGESSAPDVVNAFFKRANKYTCLLIVPTATLLLLFADQVVGIVYGSAYSSAGLFLAFSVLVYFLAAIGSLSLTSLFNGLGQTRLTFKVALVNLIAVIIISPVFARPYGVVGVVLANLIGGIASSLYAAYTGMHKLKVHFETGPTAKIYLAGLLASLMPLVLLHFLWNHFLEVFIIGALLYLIIYMTLTPLLDIIDERELAALERMTTKIRGLNTPAKPILKYMRKIHTITHKPKK